MSRQEGDEAMMSKRVLMVLLMGSMVTMAAACADKKNESADQVQPAEVEAAEAAELAEPTDEQAKVADDSRPKAGVADELPPDMELGQTTHFGAPFTIDGEPVTLASALGQARENEGPYKVEATIEKVCKKKGCWFTLVAEDVEIPIRVRMKDYGFFIARNADGARVILEGTLNKVTVPQEVAQHFADDEVAGTEKKAEKIEADQETYQFMATGVEVKKPSA
jgi:hypothetical protein